MNSAPTPLTLTALNRRIASALAQAPGTHDVWVTAETSDLRVAGGHCYLELVEKDPETGKALAKIRANIWASAFYRISAKFIRETGQQLRSDLKVMVYGTANFHPLYGLSFNITDINGAYTLGDVMQRRAQMIRRLQSEGIINNNRELPWAIPTQRIAVISAAGAAGYGDFMKHLYHNPSSLRFVTRLFPAVMQGERTATSVIEALEQIAAEAECWDCVVIIRGGGATTDLLSFDDYDLAANIALFPLPVITGIGHDRDRTVLGHVSKVDVKTPTDAAQAIIALGEEALDHLHQLASDMLRAVTERIGGCHKQLAYMAGTLPAAVRNALSRAKARIDRARMVVVSASERRIKPERVRLAAKSASFRQAIGVAISRQRTRLDTDARLLDVLSPQATLRRGYSITRIGGHAITSAQSIPDDAIIETILAEGSLLSVKCKV